MWIELVLFALTGVAWLVWRFKKSTQYWTDQGVAQNEQVSFPMGDNPMFSFEVQGQKTNIGEVTLRFYEQTKQHKYFGTYAFCGSRTLIVHDLDFLKHILVKDFPNFINRFERDLFDGTAVTDQIFGRMLTTARNETWSYTRHVFSPIFTSGKMKMMVRFIEHVSARLQQELAATDEKVVDAKTIMGKYSMDNIAAAAFGLDTGSFEDEDSPFVQNAKQFHRFSSRDGALFFLNMMPGFKQIIHALKIPIHRPKQTKFFYDLVINTLKERRDLQVKRNDIIDLMVAAIESDKGHFGQENELIVVATAVVILTAGYDTTSLMLSYLTYELAMNPDVQEKLQREIDEACIEADRKMPSYDRLPDMEYMDMVINETLRRSSPLAVLTRGVKEEYTIPGTDVVLPKGSDIQIPVIGFHHDKRYFERPNEFYPEHFTKEAKQDRHPYAFLPFGEGPRHCIGMRFAMLELKMGLISIFSRFNVKRCEETPAKLSLCPTSFASLPKEPVLVRFERRQDPSMEALQL